MEDDARLHVVRAEVDERSDRAFGADDIRDGKFVEAVLHGYHASVVGEVREQCARGGLGVVRLGREHDGVPLARECSRHVGGHARGEFRDWAGDPESGVVDGSHVFGDVVHDADVVAGAHEMCRHGAADGARAPDEDSHFRILLTGAQALPQEPSSSARVSSTATCQRASMSSSER